MGLTEKSAEHRFYDHVRYSNYDSKTLICKALKKYGKENFELSELETCNSHKELTIAEIKWIAELKTYVGDKDSHGYNLTRGGEGMTGFKHSEQSLQKMSETHKGRKASEETKLKRSKSMMGKNTGKKRSLETRKKQSDLKKGKKPWNIGISYSEEQKKNLRKFHIKNIPWNKGRKGLLVHSEETKKIIGAATTKTKSQEIMQYYFDGNEFKVVATFPSAKIAHQQTGIGHIAGTATRQRYHAGGYFWKYCDIELDKKWMKINRWTDEKRKLVGRVGVIKKYSKSTKILL